MLSLFGRLLGLLSVTDQDIYDLPKGTLSLYLLFNCVYLQAHPSQRHRPKKKFLVEEEKNGEKRQEKEVTLVEKPERVKGEDQETPLSDIH